MDTVRPEDRIKRLKEISDLIVTEKDHDKYLELMKEMNALLDEFHADIQKPPTN
jgi:hypothetical protein